MRKMSGDKRRSRMGWRGFGGREVRILEGKEIGERRRGGEGE